MKRFFLLALVLALICGAASAEENGLEMENNSRV